MQINKPLAKSNGNSKLYLHINYYLKDYLVISSERVLQSENVEVVSIKIPKPELTGHTIIMVPNTDKVGKTYLSIAPLLSLPNKSLPVPIVITAFRTAVGGRIPAPAPDGCKDSD